MTLREMIVKTLDYARGIDTPLVVRIVRRDSNGVVTSVRFVSVSHMIDESQIVIEASALEEAKEERLY